MKRMINDAEQLENVVYESKTNPNKILGTDENGNIVYKEISGGDTNLEVNPTFKSGSGTNIENSLTITEEEMSKIINGEINTISGLAKRENGQTIPFCVSRFFFEKIGPSSHPIIRAHFYGTIYSNYNSSSFTLRTFEISITQGDVNLSLYIKEFNPVMG